MRFGGKDLTAAHNTTQHNTTHDITFWKAELSRMMQHQAVEAKAFLDGASQHDATMTSASRTALHNTDG